MKNIFAYNQLLKPAGCEEQRNLVTGFTLVELLIASSIFLIIMMTIYSSFHAGIFGYKNIEGAVDVHQSARQFLERINLDIRNSFVFSEKQAKFFGNKEGINFLTIVDTYDGDRIIENYAFVAYQIEGDKLTRQCRRGKESLNDNSTIQFEEMALNAAALAFSYGYSVNGQEAIKWKDTWGAADGSPEEQRILPIAVKIKLAVKNNVEYNFERTIFLPQGAMLGTGS